MKTPASSSPFISKHASEPAHPERKRPAPVGDEGVFRTSADGKYLSVNATLARLYGYSSPHELMNSVSDIGRQLYVDPGRRKEFARLMKNHGEVCNFESPIRRSDGSVIWISENARETRDSAGVLTGYEGTVVEITSRVQAELQQRKRKEADDG